MCEEGTEDFEIHLDQDKLVMSTEQAERMLSRQHRAWGKQACAGVWLGPTSPLRVHGASTVGGGE